MSSDEEPVGDGSDVAGDPLPTEELQGMLGMALQDTAALCNELASRGVGANVKLGGSTILKSRHKDWSDLTVEFESD